MVSHYQSDLQVDEKDGAMQTVLEGFFSGDTKRVVSSMMNTVNERRAVLLPEFLNLVVPKGNVLLRKTLKERLRAERLLVLIGPFLINIACIIFL